MKSSSRKSRIDITTLKGNLDGTLKKLKVPFPHRTVMLLCKPMVNALLFPGMQIA